MAQSAISYNVNGIGTPRPDVLEKHIAAINPRWLLIMDNLGMAQSYRRKFPNLNVVHRNWALTKGDENVYSQLTPAQWLEKRQAEAVDGIYLYTGNEAGIAAQWHIDLMKLIVSRGLKNVRLVICNCAIGTPTVPEWSQPIMREFFQLLHEHRDQFVLGLHEYFSGIAPSGFVGGYPDGSWSDGRTNLHPNYENRANWPEDASNIGMLWHCGRFKVVNDAAKFFGFMAPRILITEHGADDLADVAPWAKKFPLTPPYQNHRGWKSLREMWAKLLPGRSEEKAFFENVRYLNRAVYSHFPNVEGQLLFTWSSKNDWAQFDMSAANEFMTLLEDEADKVVIPVTSLPTFPADFDSRAKAYIVTGTQGAVPVRQKPTRNSALLALVGGAPGLVSLIDVAELQTSERVEETIDTTAGVWLPVMVGTTIKGWCFNGWLDVQPVKVVPDPQPDDTVTWTVNIKATYTGKITEREASKQAWAALADFIRQVHPANVVPDVTVSE